MGSNKDDRDQRVLEKLIDNDNYLAEVFRESYREVKEDYDRENDYFESINEKFKGNEDIIEGFKQKHEQRETLGKIKHQFED